MYLGEIKKWNDPALKKLNPNAKLPDQAIALVHRSDGSGTTFIFTNYLSKVSADWKSKVGSNTSVEWPAGIGAKGNEGVANNVGNTKGALGYVETAYAKQNHLTTTKMINKDGKTVIAVPEAIMAAAAGADWAKAPGFYMILTDSPGAKSWPIAGATFILVPKQPKDAAATKEALDVLRLGLQERRRHGVEPRLHPDARQRRQADPCALEERDQGRRRQAGLLRNVTSATPTGKGATSRRLFLVHRRSQGGLCCGLRAA